MEEKEEICAAISMAMYEYTGYTSHVIESGMLTIEQGATEWNSRLCTLRKTPQA